MTEVVKWVTAVLAIWGAVSILVAVLWGLIGRRIFRKPPTPPATKGHDPNGVVWTGNYDLDRRQLDRLRGGDR